MRPVGCRLNNITWLMACGPTKALVILGPLASGELLLSLTFAGPSIFPYCGQASKQHPQDIHSLSGYACCCSRCDCRGPGPIRSSHRRNPAFIFSGRNKRRRLTSKSRMTGNLLMGRNSISDEFSSNNRSTTQSRPAACAIDEHCARAANFFQTVRFIAHGSHRLALRGLALAAIRCKQLVIFRSGSHSRRWRSQELGSSGSSCRSTRSQSSCRFVLVVRMSWPSCDMRKFVARDFGGLRLLSAVMVRIILLPWSGFRCRLLP